MTRPQGGSQAAEEPPPRRLYVCTAGFLRDKRLRRILTLAGYQIRLGLPGPQDFVGVWGRSAYAWRGEALAQRQGAQLLRVEDAPLRSVKPGRAGEAPLGLMLDALGGVHFDPDQPSEIERLLAEHPLSDPSLLSRASDGIARLRAAQLSKYNAFPLQADLPPGDFVLVVDQTRGDASLLASGAGPAEFAAMLARARAENPGARILIKTHPETTAGLRQGHFSAKDCDARSQLFTDPVSPWQLFERASAVYTISSQLGLEAILAGHRPKVFGRPFYAGWGLSEDFSGPFPRRGRLLSAPQLFAAAYLLAPVWYDPYRDRLTNFETVADTLEAEARAWREDHKGYAAWGMRAWKRAPLQKVLGAERPLRFCKPGAPLPADRRALVWSSKAEEAPPGALRMEDGFLRSRGLGADLVPPLSLVLDKTGIYYDPTQPSDLEALIAASAQLPPQALGRAERLREAIIDAKVSKYNLAGQALAPLPAGRRILVPGQVEDDASILTGTDPNGPRRNLDLLKAARAANPGAVLIYKPHPDVEAGLRPGAIPAATALQFADVLAAEAEPLALIDQVDAIWTLTSLLGFEALIRGKDVTCLGLPFYAGWGLTEDLGLQMPRRRQLAAQSGPVTLAGLIHAALIDYPRYFDPVTGRACPPEVAVERLSDPSLERGPPSLRALAKLQGWFAGYAAWWR